jgi:putative PIG3 family NAD(P)H quinone oxidoreductase
MDLPTTMTAVDITEPGGPEVLRVVERPVPEPGPGEVLIRVHAAGVNRPDCLQRQGLYPVPADADPLPGLEVAGEVVAAGDGPVRWQPGDRVCALAHGGGYAEYCRAAAEHCLPVPDGLGFTEAASLPETFFTVWYNVFMRVGLAEGEWLLAHGGSSGIGSAAIQMAKARGAGVIVTAGTDAKCGYCRDLGADHAVNYRDSDWVAAAKEITGNRGVDVVLDMVAGPYVDRNLDVLAYDGRYALIAFLLGPKTEANFAHVLRKRLTITGSALRPQTVEEKAAIAAGLEREIWPLLEAGRIRPTVFASFPLIEAARAHALMESGEHMGKIVLET